MKKTFLILMIVVLGVIATSCGNKEKRIEGKWTYMGLPIEYKEGVMLLNGASLGSYQYIGNDSVQLPLSEKASYIKEVTDFKLIFVDSDGEETILVRQE